MPDEREVCDRLPYEYAREAEKVLPNKSAEIVVYGMNTDCSAPREEARELTEMSSAEGKRALGSRARGGEGATTVSEVAGRGISASAPRVASPTAALLSCLIHQSVQ